MHPKSNKCPYCGTTGGLHHPECSEYRESSECLQERSSAHTEGVLQPTVGVNVDGWEWSVYAHYHLELWVPALQLDMLPPPTYPLPN